jgi:hypothetical protein
MNIAFALELRFSLSNRDFLQVFLQQTQANRTSQEGQDWRA